jgi:hypothetical protein
MKINSSGETAVKGKKSKRKVKKRMHKYNKIIDF